VALSLCVACTEPEDAAVVDAAPRRDALPADHMQVIINEVSVPEDKVELFNPGADVSLEGWALADEGFDPDDVLGTVEHRVALPAMTLPFGGRLEVANLPFGLGAADRLQLLGPTGTVVDEVAWGVGEGDPALCRLPDGTGGFLPCALTIDAANRPLPPRSAAALPLVINEVSSEADAVEIVNIGPQAVDLSPLFIADRGTLASAPHHLTGTLASGEVRVLKQPLDFLFGLGNADGVWLLDADGAILDTTSWPNGAALTSWCRSPDLTGAFRRCATATLGALSEPPTP